MSIVFWILGGALVVFVILLMLSLCMAASDADDREEAYLKEINDRIKKRQEDIDNNAN